MMKVILAVFSFLISFGVVNAATSVYPPNPAYANFALDHIQPYRGTYYDPEKGGTGIQVDVGANGSAFVTYYSYSTTGQPSWYILQSNYQPSDEVTRWTTGVIGTMSGPLYQAFGGQCLGCPYTANGGAVVSPFTATLTWVNSREVKMVVGSETWDFVAPNFDGKVDGDYLVGTWVIHILQYYNGNNDFGTPLAGVSHLVDNYATIKIKEDVNNISVDSRSAAGITTFGSAFKTYTYTCNEIDKPDGAVESPLCTSTFQYPMASLNNGSHGAFEFWFDQSTNRIGADVVSPARKIGPENLHVDLYIENADLIIGRGITEGTEAFGTNNYEGLFIAGQMNTEIILQRVPDGFSGVNNIFLGQ